jgi:L-asparaginase II
VTDTAPAPLAAAQPAAAQPAAAQPAAAQPVAASTTSAARPARSDDPFAIDPILVEVVRNGTIESVHHGRVAVTAPDGSLIRELGAVFAPMYPRSSSKPLQTLGMVRAGLDLPPDLLALVCASHSGEPFHVDGVRRILAGAGLTEADLQTPPAWPVDERAALDLIRAGQDKSSIAMNCSGKHAGMLATAKLNGWPTQTYRDPDHPVQLAILQTIDDLAGEQAGLLAVDGCGAPLYALSLHGLARAFGRLAGASEGPEARIAEAIRAYPKMVSGTRRDELDLHRAIPGLIGKAGAEAVYAVGLPDGTGIAIKISDGSGRARVAAMAATMQKLGYDHPTLEAQAAAPVLGHGEPAGVIRPAAETFARL